MVQKISRELFALVSESEGSNCFLLKGSRIAALIDPGTASNREQLLGLLKSAGLRQEDIRLILHTHGHADHFGADFLFPRAEVVMHKSDALAVNSRDADVSCSSFFLGVQFPEIKKFLSGKQIIDLGGIKLRVIETPGHTRGSVCFFEEKQGWLFSGDTLFVAGSGRADLPGGDAEALAESLFRLQKLKIALLLPGHGGILRGAEKNRQNVDLALSEM
ncbi:MAG: MBL fold metallo-hydrolase [Candidatus Diapherotrites archaeon]|nr:MBL fold metallo-hydrolase [Candidatus Diapherotrites archaeon]